MIYGVVCCPVQSAILADHLKTSYNKRRCVSSAPIPPFPMEGAFADILVLAANPLEDVTIFDRTDENVLAVLKEGRCVRSAVEGLKAEVTL
ncbi:hypothetical protein BT69DRAFT_1275262 [Atractiella rhizophila]|nr:hypothetical protein BT69DRAFT_1275262 [Atractiella rhizophila]